MPRDSVVVCTKASKPGGDAAFSVDKVIGSLDASLKRLGLDYVDVFQLHAVPPAAYDHVRDVIAPALLKEREKGKFRFLGITETAPNDPEQHMLNRAMQDEYWDTAMVAFHLMDQVARTQVFPHTLANRIGTLMMFAVRSIFARPAQLAATMRELAAAGQVPAWLAETDDPLGFLVHPDGREQPDRCRLPLCAARARGGCRAVRHRRCRASADQHRLDPEAAVAGGGPGEAAGAVQPFARRRAGGAAGRLR